MRLVAEVGHVEHPRPTPSGVEDLFLEERVPFVEEAVDEHQGLECDDPVASFTKATRDGGDAGEDVAAGEGGEAEDLADVLLARGVVVVARGFHDGYLQIWRHVARYFRDPDACLVLNRSDRFADTRRHSPKPDLSFLRDKKKEFEKLFESNGK